MNKNFLHVVYVPMLIIAIALLLRCCYSEPVIIAGKSEYKKRSDTSTKVIAHKPVQIEATAKITPRPRLRKQIATRYIGLDSNLIINNSVPFDSVEIFEPFTASLDSIVGKDTVSVAYDYPENRFRVAFKRAADSVQVINTTETITHYIAPAWYEKPSFTVPATAGTIIAILLLVR